MRISALLTAGAAILGVSASAQSSGPPLLTNEHKEVIVTETTAPAYAALRYAPSVRAGNTLYLSGVVAEQRLGEEGTDAAYERAFAEIEEILAASGASWANVVEVTSYHSDFKGDFLAFWAFKEGRVPSPYPAWTAVGVSDLYAPTGGRGVAEIKVTAVLPE